MNKNNDSKVQFFNSQSSFGSHSNVSVSRLQFFNDEIISDTQAIFSTLNQILLPREDLLQKQKLDQLIHRARILSNQTINEHKNLFPSTVNAPEHKQALHKCDVKLKQLIHDYDRYQKKTDQYRYFYEKYTHSKKNFQKKQSGNCVFVSYQPDVVIIQNSQKKADKKLKASNRLQNPHEQASTSRKGKQLEQLSEQLSQLRRRQSNILKNHQQQIQNIRQESNERIKRLLLLFENNIDQRQKISILKNELQNCHNELEHEKQRNRQNKQRIKELLQKNELLLQDKNKKQQDIQILRRLSQSRNENQQELKRSVHSDYDTNSIDVKKMQKKIRNLRYENQLLKNQLHKERQQLYKLRATYHLQNNQQIYTLRQKLEQKNDELKQNKLQADQNILQIIKLTDQLQKSIRTAQLAKLQATKSQGTQQSFNPVFSGSRIQDMNRLQQSRNNLKYTVQPYVGDGNQHYPYFSILSKQFKIRFKRACIKQKQLLYKLNMLEVGIISQFQQPNQIKLLLHLSNFSDHENISNLSIKVSNAKNNKIVLEKSSFHLLEMQQQVKTFVNVFVKVYPIGCTALIIQYQYLGAKQQARIILPAHIFKMLSIKPRDDQFRSPKRLQIHGEKKIIKDSQTLMSYFKQASHQGNRIRSTIFHQHTMTKLLVDIEYKNGELAFEYEHRMGDENITEYVVKALGFLFRKQENS